ncbi:Arc family DNA-binding protein [Neisseriaceae bacterium CLB008]
MTESKLHRSQYRIPTGIIEWVRENATKNRRSLNSEIIYILEKAMKNDQKTA